MKGVDRDPRILYLIEVEVILSLERGLDETELEPIEIRREDVDDTCPDPERVRDLRIRHAVQSQGVCDEQRADRADRTLDVTVLHAIDDRAVERKR